MDYLKIADRVELLPEVNSDAVRTILRVATDHWLTQGNYIRPDPSVEERDPLGLSRTRDLARYMRSENYSEPMDAVTELLSTPRALKHMVQDVDDAWNRLRGEAELSDIIVLTTLRYGAHEALAFITRNIDRIRKEPRNDKLARTRQPLKEEWEQLLTTMKSGAAVRTLVDVLE